jgi:hypothetical protein
MSELFADEPSIATAGADPGRRKAAAHEARGGATTNHETPGALERYGKLAVLADFIRELGGDRSAMPRAINGGRR